MYLLNAETTIQWVLPPTGSPLLYSDFDLVRINPLGTIEYLTAPIDVGDYTAPDAVTPGLISYPFTPTLEGMWKILLVTGTAASYSVHDKTEMFVFDNTEVVPPSKNTALGVAGSIEVDHGVIPISNAATKLIFSGGGLDVTETGGVVTIAHDAAPIVTYQSPSDLLTALSNSIDDSLLVTALKNRIDLIDGAGAGSVDARDAVIAADVTTLESRVDDASTGLIASANAITVVEAWTAAADAAFAGTTAQFATRVGDAEATIVTHTTSIDGIHLNYTVKVDNNGYVSGFGFSSDLKDAVPFSEFAILANKFTIAPVATDPNEVGGETAPFFHLTSPDTVDGVLLQPGTYMKSAYIGDATITNAMITDTISGVAWTISKSGGIDAASLTFRATDNSVLLDSDGSGSIITDIAAAGSQTIATLALDPAPSGDGFYGDATNLGYYKSGAWKTYMGKTGDFALVGDAGGGLSWNATTNILTITGAINVTNVSTVKTDLSLDNVDNTSDATSQAATLAAAVWADVAGTANAPANNATVNTGAFATLSGKVTAANIASYIDAIAIGTAYIANLAVTEAKIGALAVTAAKIGSLAVTTAKIDALAVTSAKIALLAVDTAQIADAAIDTAKVSELEVGKLTGDVIDVDFDEATGATHSSQLYTCPIGGSQTTFGPSGWKLAGKFTTDTQTSIRHAAIQNIRAFCFCTAPGTVRMQNFTIEVRLKINGSVVGSSFSATRGSSIDFSTGGFTLNVDPYWYEETIPADASGVVQIEMRILTTTLIGLFSNPEYVTTFAFGVTTTGSGPTSVFLQKAADNPVTWTNF